MLNITYKNQVKQVPVGTKLIDFLDEAEKTNYIVCRVGLQIKELNYALQERNNGMEIEFLGLENIEAGKAYEASLRFIIAMAFHNLYKDVDIRFSYNVSRAIFCQVLTPGFHLPRATDAIINEVKRIIKANLPIERVTVTIDEAKEIYKQYNHQDKLDILKYRPENTVHLYKCGDYYDYMHSYMVASTGCDKTI